ncbi:hypothetical protein [Zhihengliuella halotolerans]|uniref:Uncharacterized protein n=1 Tax=Zhihengliuella halotolerans TaxID=370736 RepID=A0A4Q8AFE0_9MICC|nr:hypothetical protein [Zhihengliuella halotolerans]RZU62968.1 hypothetical protein EV380_2574 [Zhihengliuella halotolerans]
MTNSTVVGDAAPKRQGWRRLCPTKREVWGAVLVATARLAHWWAVRGWDEYLDRRTGGKDVQFYFAGLSQEVVGGWLLLLSAACASAGLTFLAWSLIGRITRRPWRWVAIGVASLVGLAVALYIFLAVAVPGLLYVSGIGGCTRFEAEDGRSVLVTVAGMRDPGATIHTEYDAFHYERTRQGSELGSPPNVGSGECQLTGEGELLILTCGSDVVEIEPR